MKITICQFWSPPYDSLAAITWKSKTDYAARHGYKTRWEYHKPGVDIMWDRPRKWWKSLEAVSLGEWCLFAGCDTLITNPERTLESFIESRQDADMLCLVDHYMVFGDCHLFKSSPKTQNFLKMLSQRTHPGAHYDGNEQEAMTTMLSKRSYRKYQKETGTDFGTDGFYQRAEHLLNSTNMKVRLLNKTGIVGDDSANWPPGDIPAHHSWTPDHLMLHLGGISYERRMELIPSYLKKPESSTTAGPILH